MRALLTRRRGLALVAVTALAALLIGWWLVNRDTGPGGGDTQTVKAGAVEVRMTPLALGGSGARFRIVLDTHAVELTSDLAAARLSLNGDPAGSGAWTGSAPGGHHREGILTYTTPVLPGSAVELRIPGLPGEVVGTWRAPS